MLIPFVFLVWTYEMVTVIEGKLDACFFIIGINKQWHCYITSRIWINC